jgi:4-hydroxy-tetrahydrodipicolinate reductase
MGKTLVELIATQDDLELVGGVETFGHPNIGRPLGKGMVVSELETLIDEADVIIDFTTPAASLMHLSIASTRKKPYVLGTTGFDAEQTQRIHALGASLPLIWAPNFSVGMNVMYSLTEQAAKLLGPDYDAEVIEFHHRKKQDAPSGTARRLARILSAATGRSRFVYGREGQVGAKPGDEIGVLAVRSGDVVGDHYVILGCEGERVELVHKATGRLAFAQGALRAARFIVNRQPGLYGMNDVLGLPGVESDSQTAGQGAKSQ